MYLIQYSSTESTQKQLGCKKGAVLFKMANVKKVVKKGGGQEMAVMV